MITIICKQCNKEHSFPKQGRVANARKFCSARCYGLSKKGKTLEELVGKDTAKLLIDMSKDRISKGLVINNHRADNLGKYAKKGAVPWNKGKKGVYTEEVLSRMSLSKKGKPLRASWGKERPSVSGESHWNWKGGISERKRKYRVSTRWRRWRTQVFERDHYTCKNCGDTCERGNKVFIEPHHSIGVAELVRHKMTEHIFNIDNGVTLCRPCHRRVSALSMRKAGY